MWLILDNREEGNLQVSGWMNNKLVQSIYSIKENNDFLLAVERFLSEHTLTVDDLKGLGVYVGMGRFTASRLLVTLANSLAYSLQIPVLRLEPQIEIQTGFTLVFQAIAGKYILPVYSGEPHISSLRS